MILISSNRDDMPKRSTDIFQYKLKITILPMSMVCLLLLRIYTNIIMYIYVLYIIKPRVMLNYQALN